VSPEQAEASRRKEPSTPRFVSEAEAALVPANQPPRSAEPSVAATHAPDVTFDTSHELPPPVEVSFPARAIGALVLARDILVQTLDRPGLKRAADVVEGLSLAVRTGLGVGGGGTALDPFGKDPALLSRLEPLLDFLYERYWRVTVENAAALPSGPAILVANHAGALPLDGPLLALAVSRERPDLQEPRWLVEDQIFHAPFWGALLNRLGAIRASPENALRLLAERRPVLVFPEGVQGTGKGYRERYQLKRFGRGGFVKLALRTGAPIVPVAVVGSEEASPVLAKLPGRPFGLPYLPLTTPVPLPVRWSVRFGAPLHLTPSGDELAYVQQITERTRSEIEAMLQSLLRERAS
jgi:1-acyl-sn-glycerol-3-phosphate acyltransferase